MMPRSVFGAPPQGGGISPFGTRANNRSNPAPSGVQQGTMGGIGIGGIGISPSGRRPGMKLTLGDEGYLWVLIAIEIAIMAFLRKKFRRYHGG